MNDINMPRRKAVEWMAKAGTFFGLSILWLVCCLPLVTVIPACVALYDTVVHSLLGVDEHPFKRFFKDFRSELLRGMGLSLIWLAVAAVFFLGYHLLSVLGKGNSLFLLYSVFYAGTMLIPLAMLIWVIPVESRFSVGFGGLHKMALTMALVHLPTTAALLGMLVVAAVVLFFFPPMLMLVPAILPTVQAVLIEKVLVRYEAVEEPEKTEEPEPPAES